MGAWQANCLAISGTSADLWALSVNDKHAKRRDRDHRRAAKLEATGAVEPWLPPSKDSTDSVEFEVFLDATNRLVVRRDSSLDGALVDYAIIHLTDGGSGWEEVTSIDCCHGTVHRHDGGDHGKSKVILPIATQHDVQRSFDGSYDKVFDSYLAFKERA